jgi:myo-inositol-1(or 4)-monophosphatase
MATGFACLRDGLASNNLVHFNRIVPRLRDIRRYGSAALDLCYTACGRLDGYWEMNLNIYDIAAGVVILREAGGRVSDFSGDSRFPERGIAVANASLHKRLIDNINPKG